MSILAVTNHSIKEFLGFPRTGRMFVISQVDSLRGNHNTLMFINKSGIDLEELDSTCEDCVFLIDDHYPYVSSTRNDFIYVENPKFEFCRVVEQYKLLSKLQIASYSSDGTKCVIIGSNCHIDESAIIGGIDFSPVMGRDRSQLVQFPQLGGVKLGDNVVVKYNSMIGRGTFDYTIVGDNTMIDYGCQIGHNCIIGNACIIAAGTIVGGSTKIGDNCTIGIGAKIRNGLTIGRDVSIGMGAVVIRDIPDGCTVVGNPARVIEHKQIFDERGLV